jgi:hypothetical protein
MAGKHSSSRRRTRTVRAASGDEFSELLGELSTVLALLRTCSMAFAFGEEHQERYFGPQVISLEIAVKKLETLYTRLDVAILRVQR